MYQKIKLKVRDWFFPDYIRQTQLLDQALEIEREGLKRERQRLSQLDVVDAVREQLKGFSPKLLDVAMYDIVDFSPSILDQYENEESETIFLSKVRDLYHNEAFRAITDYLVRNQIIYIAKEALNFNDVQFGRASINGIILVKDEVERLKAIYDERHPAKEEFDVHEVT